MFPSYYTPPRRGKTVMTWPSTQAAPDDSSSEQPTAENELALRPLTGVPATPLPGQLPTQALTGSSPSGSSRAGQLGARALQGIRGAGQAVANNPMAAIAVAQGAAGLLSYATAKAPKALTAPKAYQPNIRGAQGMEAGAYEQARQDIGASQQAASAPGSADASTGVVQKLLASREAGRSLNALANQDNQAYQTDVRRVDAQEQQVYDRNYSQQRSFEENKYNDDRRLYEARRLQSQAQLQGAVTTLGSMYESRQQDKQLALESKNRQAEASIKQIHTDLASATTPEEKKLLLAKLAELDPQGIRTQQASVRYGAKLAGGGSLPTPVGVEFKAAKPAKASTTAIAKAGGRGRGGVPGSPLSVQSFHALSKDFNQQLSRVTAQASQHFQRSLEAAMRLRSASIPSSLTPTRPNVRR